MDEILTTQDTDTSAVSKKEVTEGSLFTQEQLDKIISKRISKLEKDNEAKIREIVNQERSEAEKLAKMSAEEREKEIMNQYKAEIEAKEKALRIREMHLEATNLLNKRQIPIDLVDFVVNEDAETTKSNIDKLEKLYKKAVENAVNERLKGKPIEDYSSKNNVNSKKLIDAVTVF